MEQLSGERRQFLPRAWSVSRRMRKNGERFMLSKAVRQLTSHPELINLPSLALPV
jgi:hypothetical protein